MTGHVRRVRAGAAVLRAVTGLVVTTLAIGCGGAANPRPDRVVVTGKVTCGGEPLPGGSIVLYSATSPGVGVGMIADDGGFRCTDVPIGPVVCVIENESLKPYMVDRTLPRLNPAVTAKATSPLKAEIVADGPNVLTFDVTPPAK